MRPRVAQTRFTGTLDEKVVLHAMVEVEPELRHNRRQEVPVCQRLGRTGPTFGILVNIAMHAIAAHAGEREAHVREVQRFAQGLPDGSYGKENRQAIAARETRLPARLRAVERAYQTAPERDAEAASDPVSTHRPDARISEREMELG